MDQKHKSNLIITCLCLIVVFVSLLTMYDNFSFHTYSTKTYYDYFLSLNHQDFSLQDYELYKDKSNYHCGDGNLVLGKIDSLVDGQKIDVIIQMNKKYQIHYPLQYLNGGSYALENKDDLSSLNEINHVQLLIKDENQKIVYKHTLKLKQVEKLVCSSKTFKVENACVSDDFMRLGYLTSTDQALLKKYPNISLEYRYLKNNKLNDKNDKNYIVFKKVNGKTKEIVNQKNYQVYNHDLNQGSLKKKKLSVVIILSKDNSQKSYVFKLNFTKENGGLHE
ncbi:MAG: hypothetical protein Q4Q31_12195 [Bacillota bacterium]|nr:hypothetical protein [Bacillota bacterium]